MKLFIKVFSWFRSRGSTREKVTALVMLGFFTTVCLAIPSQTPITALGEDAPAGYSPRFFPYIVTVLAIILSLGLLIQSLVRTSRVVEEGKGILGVEQVRRAAPVLVIMFLYLFLFNMLGYVVAAILSLGALMWYYGVSWRKEWKVTIPVVILFPLLIYYIFKYVLYVPLPAGILRALGFY